YEVAPDYLAYNSDVTFSDCISSLIIAHHALPAEGPGLADEIEIEEEKIRGAIRYLFKNVNSLFCEAGQNIFQTHLLPLMSHAKSLQTIRQIAQQEINRFLNKKWQQNQGFSWFERAFSRIKSDLEQVTDDQHYLVLFTTLTGSLAANGEAI